VNLATPKSWSKAVADEVHAIRLSAAWETAGRGVWMRRFGFPSGITDAHQIWLVVENVGRLLGVTLNGHRLTPAEPAEACVRRRRGWEVTTMLSQRNELTLVVPADEPEPPRQGRCPLPAEVGEVRLEILSTRGLDDA
jgi:hypothetical protein